MKWRDKYRLGQTVETIVPFAEGYQWFQGTIERRTATGSPVVAIQLPSGRMLTLAVDRAKDIREAVR